MQELFREFIETANRVTANAEDYTGEDGLRYCGKCRTGKQIHLPPPFDCVVPCMCKCMEEQYESERKAIKDYERRMTIQNNRIKAFGDSAMMNCTFASDDKSNKRLSMLCGNYVKEFSLDSKWLIFYGNVGVGKSYAAAMIANAVIDKGFTARFTTFSAIESLLWNAERKSDIYGELASCGLLVLDDFGSQRSSNYMDEIVFRVVDDRLRSGKPMIVTTNLTPADMLSPKDISMAMVMSRMCEKSLPIKCEGKDKRTETMCATAQYEIRRLMNG